MSLEQSFQTALCSYVKLQYPQTIFKCDHGAAQHKTSFIERNIYKKQSYKQGYPDFQLIAHRGKWHGLFIELKRDKSQLFYNNSNQLKPGAYDHHVHQYNFHCELIKSGYYATFSWDIEHAIKLVNDYMSGVIADPPVYTFGKQTGIEKQDAAADNFFKNYFEGLGGNVEKK